MTLSSTNAFLYSDIEHDQDGNKYDYLWTTYEELQYIYTLLQNPEALYAHLEKTTTSLIDKPTFLEQYTEYDQKPYSMRHMAKTVLDRGKENYPDSDNDKIGKNVKSWWSGLPGRWRRRRMQTKSEGGLAISGKEGVENHHLSNVSSDELRLGDLAVQLFGADGGVELELPQHIPHEALAVAQP